MKKTTRILAFLLMLTMLIGTAATFTGCEKKEGDSDTDSSESTQTPEGTSKPSDPSKGSYTVQIKTVGGMPLAGVTVYVYTDSTLDLIKAFKNTDENGIASFQLPKSDTYHAVLAEVPDGYKVLDKYAFKGNSCSIVLVSEVISDTNIGGVSYKLGDVMHDFTVTDTDGNVFTLSEVLKEKDGVLLNFWYTTCSWCTKEFPYMNEAYEKYKDKIAVIGLNHYDDDTEADIINYKKEHGLTIPMAKDSTQFQSAFGISGYPMSVMIDRYGVICLIESGAITSEKPFSYMFNHFSSENYEQKLFPGVADMIPVEKPNVQMPSSDEISNIFDGGKLDVTYTPETAPDQAEFSWPFIIGEKDGIPCIYPSNKDVDSSFATLYATVHLKKGDVLALDYFASTSTDDVLYILVDRKDIYQVSGIGTGWDTCYAFVAVEDGDYEVAFCYLKDDGNFKGDDRVYLKNLRIMTVDDIKTPAYIPRFCATHLSETNEYQTYSEVFFNKADGLYHVGSENGPLLLVDLMNATRFGDSIYVYGLQGKLELDGVNYFDQLLPYFEAASNAQVEGLCSVDKTLYDLLHVVAKTIGFNSENVNEWLEMCMYYDAYGTDGAAFPDPIRGLMAHTAFHTAEGKDHRNSVTYIRPLVPRGYLFRFIPTTSGVYRITSYSEAPVEGWINDKSGKLLCTYDNFSGDSERLFNDFNNVSMVCYMEAGKEYFIDIAYEDLYFVGTFEFDVVYVAESYDQFRMASPGPFTVADEEDMTEGGTPIAGGIKVKLGTDGFYHELRADGTLGSILYADFTQPLHLFTQTVSQMIELGGFNFALSEQDHMALDTIEANGGADAFEAKLRAELGDAEYEEQNKIYHYDEVALGTYHGKGKDMTETAKAYLAKLESGESAPELKGCVKVDEVLGNMLQQLMDKYTFEGVENSFTKLCYYYCHFGPIQA